MKRVKVSEWKKAMVFRNGNFRKFLNEGVYWVFPFDEVCEYEMSKQFIAPVNLNILMKNEDFIAATTIVEVKDSEIALKYENNLFADVLTPGRYVFWKGLINYRFVIVNLNKIEIDEDIEKSVLLRKEVISYIRAYTVESYEKGLLYVEGKFEKILEPGIYCYWKNSLAIVVLKVDTRSMQMEISGQELLTKDKAALRINFFVQYKVTDVMKALVSNKDYEKQMYVLMQLALREFIGGFTLDELLEKKENISLYVAASVNEKAADLGISIISSGIRDIILPGEMKEIMNQVLIAEKKAQANTIMRREETASTRSLLNTARLMEDNAMLFKLKEMEYVEKIAEKINNLSLSGGNQVVDQLKQLFVPEKK